MGELSIVLSIGAIVINFVALYMLFPFQKSDA